MRSVEDYQLVLDAYRTTRALVLQQDRFAEKNAHGSGQIFDARDQHCERSEEAPA